MVRPIRGTNAFCTPLIPTDPCFDTNPSLRSAHQALYGAQFASQLREKGEIRLSTFETSKRHDSEQKGDPREFFATHYMFDRNKDRSLTLWSTGALNACVLIFITRTGLPYEFGEDFIEINDPIAFCAEIAHLLPGCTAGLISPCIYVDERSYIAKANYPPARKL